MDLCVLTIKLINEKENLLIKEVNYKEILKKSNMSIGRKIQFTHQKRKNMEFNELNDNNKFDTESEAQKWIKVEIREFNNIPSQKHHG